MSAAEKFLWMARDSSDVVVETAPTMGGLLAILGLPATSLRHPTPTSAEVDHPELGSLTILPWYPGTENDR